MVKVGDNVINLLARTAPTVTMTIMTTCEPVDRFTRLVDDPAAPAALAAAAAELDESLDCANDML